MEKYKDLQKQCIELKNKGLHNEPCGGPKSSKEKLITLLKRLESSKDTNIVEDNISSDDDREKLQSRPIPNHGISYYGTRSKLLGEGSFGKVYLYQGGAYPKPVAIKILRLIDKMQIIEPQAIIEIATLNSVNHPNIMSLIDIVDPPDGVLGIVMDLADLGSLNDVKNKLTKLQLKKLLYDTACGISYLHHHSIVHRDIKQHNVLVFGNGKSKSISAINARISDLGSIIAESCIERPESGYIAFTLRFRSPEVFLEQPYTYASDIWSLGVMMYEIYVGYPFLYESNSNKSLKRIDYIAEIIRRLGKPDKVATIFKELPPEYERLKQYAQTKKRHEVDYFFPVTDHELKKLLDSILVYEPSNRPSAYDVTQSPFFDDVRDPIREYMPSKCKDVLNSVQPYPSNPYDDVDAQYLSDITTDSITQIMMKTNAPTVTLQVAIRLMDAFLVKNAVTEKQFNLLKVACWGIAEAIKEPYVSSMETLLSFTMNEKAENILRSQKEILLAIDYNIFFSVIDDYRELAVRNGESADDIDIVIGVALATSMARFHSSPEELSKLAIRARKAIYGKEELSENDLKLLEMTNVTTGLDFLSEELGVPKYSNILIKLRGQ